MYCKNVESKPDDKPWYNDIKTIVKVGKYPESANASDKIILRKLACHSFLNGEVLYKNIMIFEANKIMSEIHKGPI